MRTSEQTTELFTALAKAQGVTASASKDNTNPAFRSKYADLASHVDVIRPAAKDAGLCVLQELTSDDNGVHVTTRIAHTSGQWVEFGPLYIPANKHDAQGFGSAASYARRYALSAAWGTVAEDDDGNAAVASSKDSPAARETKTLTVKPARNDVPLPPRGFWLVKAFSQKSDWHEASVVDADGQMLKVSTKRQQLGALLLKFAQEPEPVWLDLTMKKNSGTEAYLNDIKSQAVYLALQQPRPELSADAMEASPF